MLDRVSYTASAGELASAGEPECEVLYRTSADIA